MKNISKLAIDMGHNVQFDGGAGSEIYSMKGGIGEEVANIILPEAVYHTVVKGDTLWGLSREYVVTLNDIVALNGVRVASLILVGEKIRIK